MHDFLFRLHHTIRPNWHFVATSLLPFVLLALILLLPPLLQSPSSDSVAEILSVTVAKDPGGPWYPADLRALVLPDDHAWLKVVFAVPNKAMKADAPPLGLFLSGTFSATAYWNGKEIGVKGRPGDIKKMEVPGPVDTVIFIAKELLQAGNNTLLMEMSSHYRMGGITTIIHGTDEIFGLRVGPYSAEARRPINYYIVPLLTAVLICTALVVLAIQARAQTRNILLPSLIFSALLVAAAAELLRSFFAYPYQYHPYRIVTVTVAVSGFYAALLIYIYRQQYKTAARTVFTPAILTLLVLGSFSLALLFTGYSTLFSLLAVLLCLFKWDGSTSKPRLSVPDIRLLAALSGMLVFALAGNAIFLDRYLYASAIPLMAAIVWAGASKPKQENSQVYRPAHSHLLIKSGGKQRLISFEDIIAIGGAGNYTEVCLSDHSKLLDDRSLKVLENLLPSYFQRIHRSYIANLKMMESLHSEGGGKHRLVMKNKDTYPVSRAKIGAIRQLLKMS